MASRLTLRECYKISKHAKQTRGGIPKPVVDKYSSEFHSCVVDMTFRGTDNTAKFYLCRFTAEGELRIRVCEYAQRSVH
jgi:hypothetical protein